MGWDGSPGANVALAAAADLFGDRELIVVEIGPQDDEGDSRPPDKYAARTSFVRLPTGHRGQVDPPQRPAASHRDTEFSVGQARPQSARPRSARFPYAVMLRCVACSGPTPEPLHGWVGNRNRAVQAGHRSRDIAILR